MHVSRVHAEIEQIVLRDAHVFEQLPRRVFEAGGARALPVGRDPIDGLIEADVRFFPVEKDELAALEEGPPNRSWHTIIRDYRDLVAAAMARASFSRAASYGSPVSGKLTRSPASEKTRGTMAARSSETSAWRPSLRASVRY